MLVGSQSVYAHTDEVPVEVLVSEACDVWAKCKEEKLASIANILGKGSPYHLTHGVFVDSVEPGLILLPAGWESRLKPWHLGDVTAWCLEVNDLVVSKLNAGRLKDYEFVNAVLRTRLADFDDLIKRIATFPDLHQRTVLLARLRISAERMP